MAVKKAPAVPSESLQTEDERLNNTLAAKLHPGRFPNMSPKMAAIVGCVLGRDWTNPRLAQIQVLGDGSVLGRHLGDIGFNDFIGHRDDLTDNWTRLLDCAGLSQKERELAGLKFAATVLGAFGWCPAAS